MRKFWLSQLRNFFCPEFWVYVFRGNTGPKNIWCRLRWHPRGPVFYNPGGTEPDMNCQDCGENLG